MSDIGPAITPFQFGKKSIDLVINTFIWELTFIVISNWFILPIKTIWVSESRSGKERGYFGHLPSSNFFASFGSPWQMSNIIFSFSCIAISPTLSQFGNNLIQNLLVKN